uniref:Ig-like domain-containing protein n=1 Tax=Ficedula albicollis TaxID=59894 RepID=A0A803W7K5_FICAL
MPSAFHSNPNSTLSLIVPIHSTLSQCSPTLSSFIPSRSQCHTSPLPSLPVPCSSSQCVPTLSQCRPSVSISLWHSNSQPGPGCLLCSVMDFYPAKIQLRWFLGHVVASVLVPNGNWISTSSWCCWNPSPGTGRVISSCQVQVLVTKPCFPRTCVMDLHIQ